jgi:hypothetical protein
MRSSRIALLLIFILAAVSAAAQQSSPPTDQSPQRDPQAVAAIQRAVSELGGAALSQVRDASVQASIQILPASSNQSFSVVWEDAWGKGAAEFRRESHVGNSISVLVSGNGQPVDSQGGIATKIPTLVSFSCAAVHLPGIILAVQLNNAAYSFKFVETTALNGIQVAHIQSALTTDPIASALSLQDWYLDPVSGLPLRVDYRIVNSADLLNPGIVSMQFASFQSTSGILVPFRLTEIGLAGEQDIVTITSVTFNSGLSSSEFLPPGGGIQ